MFYADFTALTPQEQTVWLAEVKGSLFNTTMSQNESDIVVSYTSLSFYKNFKLYAISDNSKAAPNTWYMLYKPGNAVFMDWTNGPIYKVNAMAPIMLDKTTSIDYTRFFFHFVRTEIGRFIIVEKPKEIRWLLEAEQEEKDAAKECIIPLMYNGVIQDNIITQDNCITIDNFLTIRVSVVFKDAMFHADVKIALFDTTDFSAGQMALINEELLLEGLHVVVDEPPTEFG